MALVDKGGYLSDTSSWEQIKKNLMKGRDMNLDLGFFAGSNYGPENDNLPVAQVAQYNEEGTPDNPMRPFMRYFINALKKDKKFGKDVALLVFKVAIGEMTWEQVYAVIGVKLSQDLKKVISDWETPPNSLKTQEEKGRNDPLVWTGKMRDSVEWRLGKRGK